MSPRRQKKKASSVSKPDSGAETPSRAPLRAAKSGSKRRGGFFWGLGMGFAATLIVVIGSDLGWNILPESGAVELGADHQTASHTPARALTLAGALPPQTRVYVDGKAVSPQSGPHGWRLEVPAGSRQLELRGQRGTWWSTSLHGPGVPDTLRPVVGGDIVLDVERQGQSGAVFVDGMRRGSAPGTISDVAPGWHLVTVKNEGGIVFEDATTVRPGEVAFVTVPAVPPQGRGRLTVRGRALTEAGFTDLERSPVWINGQLEGETPFEVTLTAGFHSVRVEQEPYPPRVEVLYLEAGRSRFVDAEFGREDPLSVSVEPPTHASSDLPLALPVRIHAQGERVHLKSGRLELVRPGQSEPVSVPLVPSGTDPKLWVAVLPPAVLSGATSITGYATGEDERGRQGDSEVFTLTLGGS